MGRSGLIIFAKYPRISKVKTRLAETTSDRFALDIYKICAANTFDAAESLRSSDIDILLFYEGNTETAFRDWIKKDFGYLQQSGRSLGERLADAFERSFELGYSKLAVIGTDVPDHSLQGLKSAFEALDSIDTVIGPSPDGGYYLLGMKIFHPFLFENINWSTGRVYSTTFEKIVNAGLTIKTLPALYDIDVEKDIVDWLKLPGMKSGVKREIEKLYDKFLRSRDFPMKAFGD